MNSLLSLLQLADPALPIGGYAHSAGLETYVQKGFVHNFESATAFVTAMLSRNIQYTDAALVSLAFDAAGIPDLDLIKSLDDECNAVKLPSESRMASQKLGNRLIKIFTSFSVSELMAAYSASVRDKKTSGHYPIAFAVCAAVMGISKLEALTGFYYNAASGFVTNCVKLVPLGQLDGQAILFNLQPLISKLVNESFNPDKSLIGLSCPGFDIRSMQHEQLYSRLYMS